jgi:hypothetical protein
MIALMNGNKTLANLSKLEPSLENFMMVGFLKARIAASIVHMSAAVKVLSPETDR